MIKFIYGPDQFRARRRVSQIRQEFHGDLVNADIAQVVVLALSPGQLTQILSSSTLFATKRLVILEDLLSSPQSLREEFVKLVAVALPSDLTLVLFESTEPDKRISLFKWASQHTTAERFDDLVGSALQNYIAQLSQSHGLVLTPTLINRLITLVGNDLWRMDREIAKLSAYAATQPLTDQAIAQLVSTNLENDIFGLLESINRRDLSRANRQLADLTQRGEDPIGILAVLTWQLRNLIRIADLDAQRKPVGEIIKLTGLHPYAVSISLKQIHTFSLKWLTSAYQLVTKLDWRIKQGDITGGDAADWLVATLVGAA